MAWPRVAAGGAVLVTLIAALTLVFGGGSRAEAIPDFLAAFNANYPAAVGSRISNCVLCHDIRQEGSETEYELNRYSRDLKEAGLNFRAVERIDSDGDGYRNLQEIRAFTYPGNAADNPATVVTTTTVPGGTTTSTAPGSGGALYAASCAGCHGTAGGNLVPTALSRSQLISTISGGTAGMPGFSGNLSAAEIASIADTLIAWSQTTTTTSPGGTTTTAPGGTGSGAAVYSSYCSSCHGAGGGNLVGRGLTSAQVAAAVTSGAPGMPGFSGTLSGTQISAVAGYVAGLGTTTTTVPGGSTTTAAPGGGGTLYGTYCSSCHGAGGGNLVGRGLTSAQVAGAITSGAPGMPGFAGTLSGTQIGAIAGYVAGLGTGATTTTAPGGTTSGAAVYSSFCSSCHGAAGGNLLGRGLSSAQIAAAVTSGAAGMPGFSGTLSGAEIGAVAGYVAGLGTTTTAPGGSTTTVAGGPSAGLYGTYCAGCHGPGGEGGVGGALLGSTLDAAAIGSIIADGTGGMPGFGDRLSSEEIAGLADYTVALAAGDTSTTTPGATTSTAGGSGIPGAQGPPSQEAGTSWLTVMLAALVALMVGVVVGGLLFRSARHVFRS